MVNKMNYREALEIARLYHRGQFRKGSELPYITHPIAVADRFDDELYKIVAILHDTLEDTALTSFDLSFRYKLGMNAVMAIQLLTHYKDAPYLDYILACKNNDISKAVKIEDIKHNLSDLKPGTLRDKYMLALYILEH